MKVQSSRPPSLKCLSRGRSIAACMIAVSVVALAPVAASAPSTSAAPGGAMSRWHRADLIASQTRAKKQGYNVLYTFQGGTDGAAPFGGVLRDAQGNLYGVDHGGGANGKGTVFKLAPDGTKSLLYSFAGGTDGQFPDSFPRLTMDKAGNLYGTTTSGGTSNHGVVFKIAPDGTETVLYAFQGGDDGAKPLAGVIADRKGNLYGTTTSGGAFDGGTLYRITAKGRFKVLHAFGSGSDGRMPQNGVLRDKQGTLYGTTVVGGDSDYGTVFKVTSKGAESVLYSFRATGDGQNPTSALIEDTEGNLYGTTYYGGDSGAGTVFKIAPDSSETVLHSFTGEDGLNSSSTLAIDEGGNLYGTTQSGGPSNGGTIFQVAPDSTETTLYSFTDGSDGAFPGEGLVLDRKGNLYGTATGGAGTACGGLGCGVVFELKR